MPVFALYLTDNWRAFRTWGVSANSPWEHEHFWKLREDRDIDRRTRTAGRLGEPAAAGLQPRLPRPAVRTDGPGVRTLGLGAHAGREGLVSQQPAAAGLYRRQARRVHQQGPQSSSPGETVEKQLIVINNSRQTVACDCDWSLDLPSPHGQQAASPCRRASRRASRCPSSCRKPSRRAAMSSRASFRFSTEKPRRIPSPFTSLPRRPAAAIEARRIALFDPGAKPARGSTRMGVRYQTASTPTPICRGTTCWSSARPR